MWSGLARRTWEDKHLVPAEEFIQLVDDERLCGPEGHTGGNVDDPHVKIVQWVVIIRR